MFRKKKVNKLCLETLECRLASAVSLMGDINTTPENSIPSKDIYPGSQGSMQQQPEKNQSTLHRLINKASRGVVVNNRLFREWKNSFFAGSTKSLENY